MFPPFDPEREDRETQAAVFARGQVPIQRADPEHLHLARALRRLDGDPHGDRASLGPGRGGARVRGLPRRHRRPHRAAAEGLVALRRRARFPRRLRQFRRGAGHHHLHLGARRSAQHGLDRRARFCRLRGAQAGTLQCRAGTNRSPAWKSSYFVGVPASAGRSCCSCQSMRRISACICRACTPLVLLYTLAIALLMVEPVPTFFGQVDWPADSRASTCRRSSCSPRCSSRSCSPIRR